MKRLALLPFLIVCLMLCWTGCSPSAGYGVVNWSIPDLGLSAGDIVPLHVRSNISQMYIIGTGSGGKDRAEVPLWQITQFKSRSAARRHAQTLMEFRYTYARVKLNGLPIRAAAENTSRQVYRLRQDEIIKILRKGAGAPVISRDAPLEGDWFEVMTADGTTGWCFSYNLELFDERTESGLPVQEGESGPDPALQSILERAWYPDHYRTMIANNRIDLSRVRQSWGFFPDQESSLARIENEQGSFVFAWTAIIKTSDTSWRFEGSSLTMQQRRSDSLTLHFTDEFGLPLVAHFVSLNVTAEEIIESETQRRALVLDELRITGPEYRSGNYGVLRFVEGGRFLWSGWQLLSPSIIPARAGSGGTVELPLFVSPQLDGQYTGVLSFRFDDINQGIHFLYTVSPEGIRLEHVSESAIRDGMVVSRSMAPTVLFFNHSGGSPD